MKKLKKTLFACGLFALVFALTIFAACKPDTPGKDDDVVIEPGKDYGVEYSLTDDGNSYEVTGFSLKSDVEIVIQSEYKGKPVTSIGDEAFAGNPIVSVYIPDGVTSIGQYAFFGCDNLVNIRLPDSVTYMGDYALANRFDRYGYNCLYGPLNLNEYDNALYLGNEKNPFVALIDVKDDTVPECTINENTKIVADQAFKKYSALKNLVVPGSVVFVGRQAFSEMYALESVKIGGGVKTMGLGAFASNPILENVVISDGVAEIGESAFQYSSNIKSITIPDSVKKIGKRAFSDIPNMENFTLGKNVEYIGSSAFNGCGNIMQRDDGLYYVGDWVVDSYMLNKTTLNIKPGTRGIAGLALSCTYSLTSVTIPGSVKYIGEAAFYKCQSLEKVVLSEGVTHIYDSAFEDCSALEEAVLPGSLTYIGEFAFVNDKMLKKVTFPNGVKYIGGYSFYGCALDEIVIPDSVEYIGTQAFYYIKNIDSVTVPASVKYIGDAPFYAADIKVDKGNKNYKSIDGNLYTADGKTLIEHAPLKTQTEFVVPDSVEKIVKFAIMSSSLKKISIGANVKDIAFYAIRYNSDIFESIEVSEDNAYFYTYKDTMVVSKSDEMLIVPSGNDKPERIQPELNGDIWYENKRAVKYEYTWGENDSETDKVVDIREGTRVLKSFNISADYKSVTVNIPASLDVIDEYSFLESDKIICFNVAEGNTKFKSIDGNLYSADGKTLIRYAISKPDESFVIPDGVEFIGANAFYKAFRLKSITVPSGVLIIGANAFENCYALTEITLPDETACIGRSAFRKCWGLSSITLGKNMKSIAEEAFYDCNNLKEIINASELDIVKGAETYGKIAFFAETVKKA